MKPALASASGAEKHKANVYVGTLKCGSGPETSHIGKDILEGREGRRREREKMHQRGEEGKKREGEVRQERKTEY